MRVIKNGDLISIAETNEVGATEVIEIVVESAEYCNPQSGSNRGCWYVVGTDGTQLCLLDRHRIGDTTWKWTFGNEMSGTQGEKVVKLK